MQADALRVTYYNYHKLSIPQDVIYRNKTIQTPDITKQFNSMMDEFYDDYKDYDPFWLLQKTKTFKNLVETNGRVDVKNKEFKANPFYIYNNEIYRRDDIGNIYFGFAAKTFGYYEWYSKLGAGGYQAWSGTSEWEYFSTFFDDPRDQEMIEIGFKIFDKRITKGK